MKILVAVLVALALAATAVAAEPCGSNASRVDETRPVAKSSPIPKTTPAPGQNIHAGVKH